MDSLEKKRLKLELIRVSAARAELEFKIFEREEDIKRLKDNVKIQEEKELEINKKIEETN